MRIPLPGWKMTWENDSFLGPYGTDEFYTQGLRFGYRFRPDRQPSFLSHAMGALCRKLGAPSGPSPTRLVGAASLFFGQNFFTPGNIRESQLIPDDRAYAAWLYVGARLEVAQVFANGRGLLRHGLFHSFEFQLGTVGPRAQGRWVQRNWHQIVPAPDPKGWHNQLPNEFGVEGIYSIKALLKNIPEQLDSNTRWQLQGTLDGGLNLGTISVEGRVGTTWRFGRNLGDPIIDRLPLAVAVAAADPARADGTYVDENYARPGLHQGSPCLGRFIDECFIYFSATGRAVGFNAFLDGTMFHGGHDVDKEPLVYDLAWGARARVRRFQLDYGQVFTSREFSPVPRNSRSAEHNGRHGFAMLNLQCIAPINSKDSRIDLVCPGFFGLLVGLVASQ